MENVPEHEDPVRKDNKVLEKIEQATKNLEKWRESNLKAEPQSYKARYYEVLHHLRKANKACERLSRKLKMHKNCIKVPRHLEVDLEFDFPRYLSEEFPEFTLKEKEFIIPENMFGRIFRGLLSPKGVEDSYENKARHICFMANGVDLFKVNTARIAITLIETLREAVKKYNEVDSERQVLNLQMVNEFKGVICLEYKYGTGQIIQTMPVLAMNAYRKKKIEIKYE